MNIQEFDNIYKKIDFGFLVNKNNIEWVYSQKIHKSGALHGFTRRKGGVSLPPFESLNFGFSRPEPREIILQNYKLLAKSAGFDFGEFTLVNYEHGTSIIRANSNDKLKNIMPEAGTFEPCDGLVTNSKDIVLTTLHADCTGVFLFDPVTKSSGMLHSGWKGTLGKIGQKCVKMLNKEFRSDPKNILVAISPCISQKYFEVDKPVADLFVNNFPKLDSDIFLYQDNITQKYHVDLLKLMVYQLLDANILFENINIADECTFENSENYYSFRRDDKNCGAMAGFIKIL